MTDDTDRAWSRDDVDTTYYVLDEDRFAVVAGPYQSPRCARSYHGNAPYTRVATEAALSVVDDATQTLTWDVDGPGVSDREVPDVQ